MSKNTNNRRSTKVKYVAKVPIGKNRHRYFYTNEEYQAYLKNKNASTNNVSTGLTQRLKNMVVNGKDKIQTALQKVESKIVSSVDKTVNTNLPAAANRVVDEGKKVVNKLYGDTDNIYDVTKYNYADKIEQVKQTEEWKNIVKSNNSEYVKKNSDGTTEYLIDDYLVNKKHPVLDAIGDIAAGREITINKVTKETTIAGLKDTARSAITMGMLATGVVTKLLTEKFKLGQGSYEDEIKTITNTIERGADYISDISSNQSPDMTSVMQTVNTINTVTQTSKAIRSEINETTVVNAAKVVIDTADSFSVSKAEQALTNLSDEEIQALCVLLNALNN